MDRAEEKSCLQQTTEDKCDTQENQGYETECNIQQHWENNNTNRKGMNREFQVNDFSCCLSLLTTRPR